MVVELDKRDFLILMAGGAGAVAGLQRSMQDQSKPVVGGIVGGGDVPDSSATVDDWGFYWDASQSLSDVEIDHQKAVILLGEDSPDQGIHFKK